jgi:hypothetical protein
MAECRTCHAAILWAVNAKSGKREPLDAEPREDGNIEIVEPGPDGPLIRHLTGEELPLFGEVAPRYVSHFATCPDAPVHRRPEKQRA